MKKLFVALLSALLVLGLAGCSKKDETPTEVVERTVNAVLVTSPVGLHPLKTNDSASTFVSGQIFETLYERTVDGSSYVPLLAAAMPEYSEDGLTATIKLRDDVSFHNGDKFTSAAVAYMIDCLKDPEYGSQRPSIVKSIESYECPDDYTIVLHLAYTDGILVASLAHTNGAIVNPALDKTQDLLVNPEGAGTGPYKFVSAVPSQEYVLTANTEYWGGVPEVKDIRFDVVPDENTAVSRIKNGEADFMPTVGSDSLATLSTAPGVTTVSVPNSSVYYMAYRSDATAKNDIMANVDFRKAITQAVDYEAFVNSYFQGNATFSKSIVGSKLVGYDPVMEENYIAYDPEAAKATIDANNWAGTEITFLCSTRDAHMQLAAYVQDALAKVGITVKVVSEEWATFLADAKTDEYFDFCILSWSNVTGDGHQMLSPNFQSGIDTRVKYNNPEFDALCDVAAHSTDLAVRTKAMVDAVAKIQGTDVIVSPVYSINTMYAYSSYLDNVVFDAGGQFDVAEFKLAK